MIYTPPGQYPPAARHHGRVGRQLSLSLLSLSTIYFRKTRRPETAFSSSLLYHIFSPPSSWVSQNQSDRWTSRQRHCPRGNSGFRPMGKTKRRISAWPESLRIYFILLVVSGSRCCEGVSSAGQATTHWNRTGVGMPAFFCNFFPLSCHLGRLRRGAATLFTLHYDLSMYGHDILVRDGLRHGSALWFHAFVPHLPAKELDAFGFQFTGGRLLFRQRGEWEKPVIMKEGARKLGELTFFFIYFFAFFVLFSPVFTGNVACFYD
ncbi:hypothetical protein N658DRAFT_304358 [Parathielavia hyrcaniae]|uniref:Uncharacterized protein n=1 Tax=Parathielavia hyrcaniae TaxID=113614 RepID=A0AAN6T392_9PEZI|nr:hypothetical protein N658DRAFT_304358 [Parathielavia hyrcaniae]